MPVHYSIDQKLGLVHSRGWGTVRNSDLLGHQAMLLADPAFSPNFRQLIELGEVESSEAVETRVIRELAAVRVFAPGCRRAIVATSDVVFGLARMFEILARMEGDDVQVFRDLESARRWLGLGPAPSRPDAESTR